MSAETVTAGYPPHRVLAFHEWTNRHGANFTTYRAARGHVDTLTGHKVFGFAGSARKQELCFSCFPAKTCHGYFASPVDMTER